MASAEAGSEDAARAPKKGGADLPPRAHEVVEPTAEGSRSFVEALLDPPEPNENLRALAGRSGMNPSR